MIDWSLGRIGVAGYFRLDVRRPDGRVRCSTGWFKNLVTDTGLNLMGTTAYINVTRVGTSSAAPSVTDSTLGSWLANHSSTLSTVVGAASSAPYFGWVRVGRRFNTGVATGNISEVGVGPTDAGNPVFARSLTKDAEGDPATITVLADEALDVYYELRNYAPTADVTGQVTLGGTLHDYISRAANANASPWWDGLSAAVGLHSAASATNVYTGDIGTVLQEPSGTQAGSYAMTNVAYSNNSLERRMNMNLSTAQGNLAGGIRSWTVRTTLGRYQLQFDPKIPKTSENSLALTMRVAWGRHT